MSRELIDQITQVTSGSAIFVGSVARYYNGDVSAYRDVDVVIPTSSLKDLKDNFTVIETTNGWPDLIDQTYLIKHPIPGGKAYHDVFVCSAMPSSSLISGSQFTTAEYDLHIHKQAFALYSGSYLENKVSALEALYSL